MRHAWWGRQPTRAVDPSSEFDVSRLPPSGRSARDAVLQLLDMPDGNGLLAPGPDATPLLQALDHKNVEAIVSGLAQTTQAPERSSRIRRVLAWLLGHGQSEEPSRSADAPQQHELVERVADTIASSAEGHQIARDLSTRPARGAIQDAARLDVGGGLLHTLTGIASARTLAFDVGVSPEAMEHLLLFDLHRSAARALRQQITEGREPILIAQALAAGAEGHDAARKLANNNEQLRTTLKLARSPGGRIIASNLIEDDAASSLATHLAFSDEGLDLVNQLVQLRPARTLASQLVEGGTSRSVAKNLASGAPGLGIETVLADSRRGRRYLDNVEFASGGLMLTMAILPVVNAWSGLRAIVTPAVVWYTGVALTRIEPHSRDTEPQD